MSTFPYTYADKPRTMTTKQWHWNRKHRPDYLAALIVDSYRPAALIGADDE